MLEGTDYIHDYRRSAVYVGVMKLQFIMGMEL